jgi:mono/diheme cytochrome c family protein
LKLAKLLAPATPLLVATAFQPAALADDGKTLFELHCAACHTLDKATNQRLNRADWDWVMGDMVDYGMTWLTDDQKEAIIDHLVENYGRDTPR